MKPFGDESSEDSESEPEFSRNGTSSTFALGWDTLANFNKATAWSKHDAQEKTQTVVKRSYNNKNRAAAAAENPKRRKSGTFSKNGADYGRVEQLLQQTCKCAFQNCFKQFQLKELVVFLQKFWSMPKPNQDHLLSTAFGGSGDIQKWNVVGFEVRNRVCLVTILGIGKGRLARTEAGAQDLRCGTQQRGSTVQSESVRAFFHNAYAKLGECLPDKFIRRSKSKRSCGSDSSDGEVASDPGDDDRDLLEWLDRSDTAVHNACVNAATLAKRWLPPGNLAELFDHYQTVQQLLECPAASFNTFVRVYQADWKDVLGFRHKTEFTVCDVCEQLKLQLHDKNVPLSEKLGAVTQYRRHLKDQYNDRSIAWQLCDVANQRDGDVLVLWLDAMEQAKFAVPRHRGLRTSSSTSKLQKPRMKLHGCWAFGFTLQLWCLDETSKHDSACIIEILARTIQRAFEICDQNQIQRPRHVCIVADNTVREAKNRFVMAWVHHQIARGRFRNGTLMMLRKSHTHDRIDQLRGNTEQKTGEL